MPHYIIYFNQQWVGEHSPEWFAERGPLAAAAVEEMQQAGVLLYAAGVDERLDAAVTAEPTCAGAKITNGLFAASEQHLGGLTLINVADDAAAADWGGRLAEACGWPQQIRRVF